MPERFVSIGLVQMSMSESRKANVSKAVEMVGTAARMGAEIVCLPELFSDRYFPAERGRNPVPEPVPGPTSRSLARAARKNKVVLVGGSLFEESGTRRYNTSLVFSEEGRVISKYRKVHLPQDDHYYEQDYFSPGERYSVADVGFTRIGTLICFDQWYPEPARIDRLLGAQMLFYPTAIGTVKGVAQTEGDWRAAWEAVQVGHAIANSMVVCAVNRVGVEGSTTFWGGSFVCDQFGKVLFRAEGDEGVYTAKADLRLGEEVEEGWGFMRNRKKATYGPLSE